VARVQSIRVQTEATRIYVMLLFTCSS